MSCCASAITKSGSEEGVTVWLLRDVANGVKMLGTEGYVIGVAVLEFVKNLGDLWGRRCISVVGCDCVGMVLIWCCVIRYCECASVVVAVFRVAVVLGRSDGVVS